MQIGLSLFQLCVNGYLMRCLTMFRAFACDTAARQGENYAILWKRKESFLDNWNNDKPICMFLGEFYTL